MAKTPVDGVAVETPEVQYEIESGDKKAKGTTCFLSVGSLVTVPALQPRKSIGDIKELVKSVKTHNGILQGLVVRPAKKGGKYEVVCGHRRLAAAKEAGVKNVPALIRDDLTSDSEALGIAMAENSSDTRTDLSPMEKAKVFEKFRGDGNPSAESIGRSCGCSGQTVRESLALLTLPKSLQEKVNDGAISASAAKAASNFDEAVQKKLLPLIEDGMTASAIKAAANSIVREQAGGNEVETASKARKRGSKGAAATVTEWRSKSAMRSEMQSHVADVMLARSKGEQVEEFTLGVVATFMWILSHTEDITKEATNTRGFQRGLKAVEATIDTSEAPAEAAAE